jgi:hypothetical protein
MQVGRFELVDRRVLGALRFVDAASGLPVRGLVALEGARAVRNGAGLYVLLAPEPPLPALATYADSFRAPPIAPPAGSVALAIIARPTGPYLARAVALRLPLQAADPAADPYLLRPVELRLFPAPSYEGEPGWALVRAAVREPGAAPTAPRAGVLLHVLRSPGGELLGAGVSDARGQALLAVAGLRMPSLAAPNVAVTLEARRDTRLAAGSPPDLDEIGAAPADAPWLKRAELAGVTIAPGRTSVVSIEVP